LRETWLQKIRRQNFEPTGSSRVCSDHFEDECFVVKKTNRFLAKDAIPTIFLSFPKHLQSRVRKRKKPFDRTKNKKQDNFYTTHDHTYDLPSQRELKRRYDIVMKENAILKKKIKISPNIQEKIC